jgi:RNA-binding protein
VGSLNPTSQNKDGNEMVLSGKQRKFLRGLAHSMDPVVRLGKQGLTSQIVEATLAALGDHELIKVRLAAGPADERKKTSQELAEQTNSHWVGLVGRVLILYLPNEEDPSIKLPGPPATQA